MKPQGEFCLRVIRQGVEVSQLTRNTVTWEGQYWWMKCLAGLVDPYSVSWHFLLLSSGLSLGPEVVWDDVSAGTEFTDYAGATRMPYTPRFVPRPQSLEIRGPDVTNVGFGTSVEITAPGSIETVALVNVATKGDLAAGADRVLHSLAGPEQAVLAGDHLIVEYNFNFEWIPF